MFTRRRRAWKSMLRPKQQGSHTKLSRMQFSEFDSILFCDSWLDLDAQNYANNSFDRQAGKQTKGLGSGSLGSKEWGY